MLREFDSTARGWITQPRALLSLFSLGPKEILRSSSPSSSSRPRAGLAALFLLAASSPLIIPAAESAIIFLDNRAKSRTEGHQEKHPKSTFFRR